MQTYLRQRYGQRIAPLFGIIFVERTSFRIRNKLSDVFEVKGYSWPHI
jgi:hypothetical protein